MITTAASAQNKARRRHKFAAAGEFVVFDAILKE
jgi:hypothetical protein